MTKTVAKGGSNYSAPIATLLGWKSSKPASCTHLVPTWAIGLRLTVECLIETDRYWSVDTGSPCIPRVVGARDPALASLAARGHGLLQRTCLLLTQSGHGKAGGT